MGRLLGVTVVSVAQNKLQLRLLTVVASEFVVPMCEYSGPRVCSPALLLRMTGHGLRVSHAIHLPPAASSPSWLAVPRQRCSTLYFYKYMV